MNKYSLICRSIICFAILILVASASCSPIITTELTPITTPTSTPEKLELINGEIDACLLINPIEVEAVLGVKVVSETRFAMVGGIDCKYTSVSNDQVVFLTSATTDATLKKVNSPFPSAIEAYEMHKEAELNMLEIFRIKDIENFGDQAYSKEGTFLDINILNNNIFYQFVTRTDGGIGYDALMKLAEIALQRMPQ